MRTQTTTMTVLLFLALVILWPNVIHEPLHLVALKLQGADGVINFGLHPTITRTAPISSVAGGLFFLLLPSIASIVILIALQRTTWTRWETHLVLSTYLLFDLLINIIGYTSPTSDFRFLQVLPVSAVLAIIIVTGLTAVVVVWKSLERNKQEVFA